MLRGNRNVIIAVAGLALLGANNPSNNSATNTASAQKNKQARQHQDILTTIGGINKSPKTEKTKAYSKDEQREQREIRDLQAQEKSAYWAAAMFWATIAAIILSIFGILLVWVTFRETRKATKSAQINSEAYIWNERAWIEFTDWPRATANIRATPIDAFPMITIHNSGKSVAKIASATSHEVDGSWKKIGSHTVWPVGGRLIKAGSTATLKAFPIKLDVGMKKQFIVDVEYMILGGKTDCLECRFSMSLMKSFSSIGGFELEYSK